MKKTPTVCIVGSINMDLAIKTKKIPMQGETVIGEDFAMYTGGKGANQAVSAARLGANVNMIGVVGQDEFGTVLLKRLEKEGINLDGIERDVHEKNGIANIILSDCDNRIIVSAGANKLVSPEIIDKYQKIIKRSDIVLLQLEIPLDAVVHTVNIAKEFGVPVILNPAPYQSLPISLLKKVDFLTPNKIEIEEIKKTINYEVIKEKLIITKGGEGVQFYTNNKKYHVPALNVEAKDTTGAGDTFNGALAVELGRGIPLADAIKFANAAAALSVTKNGAQNGMPSRKEVEQFT